MELDMPPFGDRSEKQRASDVSIDTPTWILSLKQVRTVTLWICIFTFFSLSFSFLIFLIFLVFFFDSIRSWVQQHSDGVYSSIKHLCTNSKAGSNSHHLWVSLVPSFLFHPYSPLIPLSFLSPFSCFSCFLFYVF